jgi:hypothetical protein
MQIRTLNVDQCSDNMKEDNYHQKSLEGQWEPLNPLKLKEPQTNIKIVYRLTPVGTTWYLLENNEVLSCDEYWALHRKTRGNHPPAIASSPDKDALLQKAKKMEK